MDRQTARRKAEELVSRMTVGEAAYQLSFNAPAIPRLGVPEYNWWNEALHGVARCGMSTMFPQSIGMAAAFSPELMRKMGEIVAEEGRAKYNASVRHGDRDTYKGLTYWAPNVNIFRDPRWGRGQETLGEDPELTARLGSAFVEGLQGDGEVMKAAACAKHFAVHSGPEELRHGFDAVAGAKDMEETYLPAFRALVDAGVESVMGAYNRLNGEPCCGSPFLQRKLRGEWGFKGHFVSDCWAINDFHDAHRVTENMLESAAAAINNGCDLNCGCVYREKLLAAVEAGLVDEKTVRESAVRVFTTRYLLGLMGEGSEYDAIPYDVVESEEHLEAAEEAARRSCVLLKNDGLLPLDIGSLRTVGVIGPNADSRAALTGNYHGSASRYVTVQEGIQDALRGRARVLCAEGSHLYQDKMCEMSFYNGDRIAEAVTVAENSDAVVLVLGLDETIEGEQGDTGNEYSSGDKRDLRLPKCQRELADAVLAAGKPTVLILMAGSALDPGPAAEKANAILQAWYPGSRGGKAVADLLFGRVSPSGKLPVTFYRNEQLGAMPDFTDYSMRGRTYRYVEDAPLYPFGYGLTYGDVYVARAEAAGEADCVRVTAEARNDGARDTQDVVQVYCDNEGSPNAPKHPRLCAFARVTVPAGQTVRVELTVPREALKVVDNEGRRIDEGTPVFWVGTGQPDGRTRELTGHGSVCVRI